MGASWASSIIGELPYIFVGQLVTSPRAACSDSVTGFPGNRYDRFYSNAEASAAWEMAVADGTTGPAGSKSPIDDEQLYWVVARGAAPGVYLGK
jgi:hypothetical protein